MKQKAAKTSRPVRRARPVRARQDVRPIRRTVRRAPSASKPAPAPRVAQSAPLPRVRRVGQVVTVIRPIRMHHIRAVKARFPKTVRLLNVLIIVFALAGGWQYYQEKLAIAEFEAANRVDETLYPVTHENKPKPSTTVKAESTPKTPTRDITVPPIVNGMAPVISRLETKQPVVFLGIDDGTVKRDSDLELVRKHKVKASLFLAHSFIKDDPTYFKKYMQYGSLIENHSLEHRLMSRLGYADQKAAICEQAELQEKLYGRRPVLFRPPGGDYNDTTRRAAADCGMKAIVLWIAKANGGGMQYQVGNGLRAGDIVLMHFRPEFPQDMKAFIHAQNAAGLHTELLTDWLAPEPTTKPN